MPYFFRNLKGIVCLLAISPLANAQSIDHWETAVNNTDQWSYFVGTSEPSSQWMQPSFNSSSWSTGQGGFGYDDGDDNTIIAATSSVYIVREFYVVDTSVISLAILHADYDDAFVAYLNGTEIARSNIGTAGTPPSHDDLAINYKEAALYTGGNPEDYILDKNTLSSLLNNGNNTILFITYIFNCIFSFSI